MATALCRGEDARAHRMREAGSKHGEAEEGRRQMDGVDTSSSHSLHDSSPAPPNQTGDLDAPPPPTDRSAYAGPEGSCWH
ncbi:hypothetical protein BO71DRAFT_119838 [Aspergillus ellipticus CBS 707.79]|uniref:Uncharacterized protein n=1 Tax=Aspergillus ellipticus CBS 707.79 TaxID=1448320 RepID=A0A319CV12_9EURO|nr:hypothetical protein BO71DRAFT_119838 [Aspergillus ellipticus CBS 707.79]